MKEFCLIVLVAYFGFKILMVFLSLVNWNSPHHIEARTQLGITSPEPFFKGLIEHIIMLVLVITLYYR